MTLSQRGLMGELQFKYSVLQNSFVVIEMSEMNS